MASDVDSTYTASWYAEHYEYAREYRAVGEALDWLFGPAEAIGEQLTAVDVGCGVGLIVPVLASHGWAAYGFDASFNARLVASAKDRIRDYGYARMYYADIRYDTDPFDGLADLVICFEVAEHLAEEHADALVHALRNTVAPGGAIAFTAAPPGQPGHEHVNCQPKAYWVAKFKESGCVLDERYTQVLKDALDIACPRMRWLPENIMVFREEA